MHPVIGGVGDLVDLVGKLGELTGSLAAGVLQHVRGQDELIAVGNVGVDEVVQQCPLQPGTHAGVHPVAGACQLHAPLVVDETQVLAKVNVVLGLKVKGVLRANIAQGLVVLLAAGKQVRVGQVGQAQHGGAVLGVQGFQLLRVVGDFLVQANGLGLVGLNGCAQCGGVLALLLHTLLLAEKLAVFLGQLVLLGGGRLGSRLQAADFHVQFQNPVDGGIAVHFLCLQTGLYGIGIFLDTLDV